VSSHVNTTKIEQRVINIVILLTISSSLHYIFTTTLAGLAKKYCVSTDFLEFEGRSKINCKRRNWEICSVNRDHLSRFIGVAWS